MSTPQMPYTFAGASGTLNLSEFDADFSFLLGLIVGLNAAAVPFTDTIGLGAANVQEAIVALHALIGSLAIIGTPPTTGTVGQSSTYAGPTVSGGTAPYTFSETGSLPPGRTFNTATGGWSGTDTTAGTYGPITITVTDSTGAHAALAPFTIKISSSAGSPGALDFSDPANSAFLGVIR